MKSDPTTDPYAVKAWVDALQEVHGPQMFGYHRLVYTPDLERIEFQASTPLWTGTIGMQRHTAEDLVCGRARRNMSTDAMYDDLYEFLVEQLRWELSESDT